MKHSVITLFIILSFQWNAFAQGNPNPNSSIDTYIQGEMNTEHFPGVSTIIVKDGEIVWVESYGYADIANNIPVQDSTIFLLASISKVFTGTAVMQLYENGLLNLDEDVNNYLPWDVDIPGYVNDSITFRRLMTHTSSITDNGTVMDTYYDYPDPTIPLSTCMEQYFSTAGSDYDANNNFLPNAPGTTYDYSNMATALDGYLAEVISGMPFDQYCNSNIFDPLCMNNTAWFLADLDSNNVARPYEYIGGNYNPFPFYGFADYPDGQLRSNVFDMANFMLAYLNGGTFGMNSILAPGSISQMWSSQVPSIDPTQGLNWYQEEIYHSGGSSMLWGHNGGEMGASTNMYLDPVNNIGICVLTNGEGDALYICDELYDYALSLNPTTSIVPDCFIPTGIRKNLLSEEVQVYPNPMQDEVTIETKNNIENGWINIFNIEGQHIYFGNFSGNRTQIDVSQWIKGIYFAQIIGNSYMQNIKLVKR